MCLNLPFSSNSSPIKSSRPSSDLCDSLLNIQLKVLHEFAKTTFCRRATQFSVVFFVFFQGFPRRHRSAGAKRPTWTEGTSSFRQHSQLCIHHLPHESSKSSPVVPFQGLQGARGPPGPPGPQGTQVSHLANASVLLSSQFLCCWTAARKEFE